MCTARVGFFFLKSHPKGRLRRSDFALGDVQLPEFIVDQCKSRREVHGFPKRLLGLIRLLLCEIETAGKPPEIGVTRVIGKIFLQGRDLPAEAASSVRV